MNFFYLMFSPPFSLARRNTLGHFPDKDKRPFSLSGRSYDDTTEPAQRPRYPETKADIERALKGGGKYYYNYDMITRTIESDAQNFIISIWGGGGCPWDPTLEWFPWYA